jgi:hypothetical protein
MIIIFCTKKVESEMLPTFSFSSAGPVYCGSLEPAGTDWAIALRVVKVVVRCIQ